MSGTRAKIGAVLALAAALSGCATSQTTVGAIPDTFPIVARMPAPNAFIAVSRPMPSDPGAAVVPSGFVSFCLRFPDQCQTAPNAPTFVALTSDNWATLRKVNGDVNSAIWPEDDQRHYGRAEFWTIPTDGYGDCEDYALTKRKELMARGFSAAALRIAIVITPRENRHAVLTVVTDKGDFVLDNLTDEIRPWDSTGFTWIERQDPANAMAWVSLRPADRMLATNTATSDQPTGTTP